MAQAMKKSACPNLFVAAIDFGTTYSGYAFSAKDDFEKDPLKISANHWNAGAKSLISHKAPTCLLLNPDKSFKSFGYEAENDFIHLAGESDDDDSDEENEEEGYRKYYYFHRFKMVLHNNKDLSMTTNVQDEMGKTLPAIDVFTHAIRYLKDHLFKTLSDSFDGITLGDIRFVLTVPAIWNDNAKQFMRLAAITAGISKDNLTIALEPEAASLYCQYHSLKDENDEKEQFRKSTGSSNCYMVVDIGGGTADITVHEKQPDDSLKELLAATGGAFGGKNVDDAFKSFLEDVVGKDTIEKFKNECMEDFIDIFREFETKKRSVTSDEGKSNKVTMTMPVSLNDVVKKNSPRGQKLTLNDVVPNSIYGNEVNFAKKNQKLHISHKEFVKLFKPAVDGIIKHMEGILNQSDFSHVKNILMVGGFSECEILQASIRNKLKQNRIIIPEDAGLAVLKGAVLFGHIPRAISGRVARYTYGIQSWPMFNDRYHPQAKRVTVGTSVRCRDVFFKFIEIGQQVTPGHREAQVFQVLNPSENSLECTVYASTERNPTFVDDPSCHQLGILRVPFARPANSTQAVEIEETLIFGETELRVKAKDLATSQEYEATLNLLGNQI
ncbi:heat shock 70 kDa protein 12A-like [Ylistrum balloti]|uniref:heat shock 70 kDa protein 12A-like n=1 Tax=Ylistrum balloti TaxID=509963 RepID=UPI002905BBAC|nr:heat shock 70 kDa protein 12A-like [Ylistrum balloti]